MINRRLQPRLLCAEIVEFHWKDKNGHKQKSVANLEDISSSGACLQSDWPVSLGTSVRITHSRGELVGTVRHCVFWEIGYFLGIEFDSASRWSVKQLQPGYLLDPKGLVSRTIERMESTAANAPVASTVVN
jgi:hypothetical protein